MSRILVPERPGGNIPGLVAAPALVVTCRHCSKPVAPAEFKDNLCWDCWVTRECTSLRDELVRLFHKRAKYVKVGANVTAMDEQATRVRIRITKVVTKLTPRMDVVERLVNEQGRRAREAALARSSRIYMPGMGGIRR